MVAMELPSKWYEQKTRVRGETTKPGLVCDVDVGRGRGDEAWLGLRGRRGEAMWSRAATCERQGKRCGFLPNSQRKAELNPKAIIPISRLARGGQACDWRQKGVGWSEDVGVDCIQEVVCKGCVEGGG